MRRTHQTSINNNVISASEIGQYHYCSVAWYLQKCGHKPESELLEIGTKKHIQHGDLIDKTKINTKNSKIIALIGYCLLAISILIIFFEVIL